MQNYLYCGRHTCITYAVQASDATCCINCSVRLPFSWQCRSASCTQSNLFVAFSLSSSCMRARHKLQRACSSGTDSDTSSCQSRAVCRWHQVERPSHSLMSCSWADQRDNCKQSLPVATLHYTSRYKQCAFIAYCWSCCVTLRT